MKNIREGRRVREMISQRRKKQLKEEGIDMDKLDNQVRLIINELSVAGYTLNEGIYLT